MNKYQSEILQLVLNDATFDDQRIELAVVNFFFGNNGTGKSTIAQALAGKGGSLPEWHQNRQANNYVVHLYDRSFVEDNFRSSEGLAGVFTLDQQNINVETEIKQARAELTEQQAARDTATTSKEERVQQISTLKQTTVEACWDESKEIRQRFPNTQEGYKKDKQKFFERLAQTSATEHDLSELTGTFQLAFDANATAHALLESISAELPASELPQKIITSSADTPYSQFIKRLGALDWVSSGHEHYETAAQGSCPYCAQTLPADFQSQLASCFDDGYQQDLASLTHFIEEYKNVGQRILTLPRAHEISNPLPGLDLDEYDTKVRLLRAGVEANLKSLDDKLAHPSNVVELQDLSTLIEEINDLVATLNEAIEAHNKVVRNQKNQQSICTTQVWELLSHKFQAKIKTAKDQVASLEGERSGFETAEEEAVAEVVRLESHLRELASQTINTEAAMISINKLLKDSGFEGFELRAKRGDANTYEVVRPDGSVARHLSEGERNFIAFLYFYFQLHGSLSSNGETRDRIVIIDDPVSSMDTGALFIVAALVRRLVDICANNYMETHGSDERDHIKQIFVLTHNAYFFREASYNRVKDYEIASFHLVQKRDNRSSVTRCVRNCREAPSRKENYTPVTNSYAVLWDEYRELASPNPLLNVMRRILEHYFLQLCGYDGEDLRTKILVDNRDRFVTTCDDGTEDASALRQAESILSYLNHEMTGLGDDLYYIEHSANAEDLRNIFREIFVHMGQEQHYAMMSHTSPEPSGSALEGVTS